MCIEIQKQPVPNKVEFTVSSIPSQIKEKNKDIEMEINLDKCDYQLRKCSRMYKYINIISELSKVIGYTFFYKQWKIGNKYL